MSAVVSVAILMVAAPVAAAPATPSPTPSSSPSAPTTPTPSNANSISWSAEPSNAQGPDRRSAFRYNNLKAGTVVSDYVSITNFSKFPVTFQLYATDAFTTSNGSLGMLAADAKPTDVGSWVKLSKTTIRLAPSERANEPFTLRIPGIASPGDHTGGIIAAVAVTTAGPNGANVKVDRRLAVPIFLRVSGALHSQLTVESLNVGGYTGNVNPFGGGRSSVAYTIHNTGNVRLNVGQSVAINGPFGLTVGSASPKPLSDLLPGQSVRVTKAVPGVFPAGPLTVHIHLAPSEPKDIPASGAIPSVVARTVSLWATPWPQLVLLLIVIGIGCAIVWRRRHAKRVLAKAVDRARRETVAELSRSGASTG
jgi:hypothetical protein